jgi:hypothetical protein
VCPTLRDSQFTFAFHFKPISNRKLSRGNDNNKDEDRCCSTSHIGSILNDPNILKNYSDRTVELINQPKQSNTTSDDDQTTKLRFK